MERWQRSLARSIAAAGELAARFGIDPEPLRQVTLRYPLRITPHYLSLIEAPDDPIWRQCVPDPAELADDGQSADPLAEKALSPVPGLIHRYPDRVVWLVSNACAVYCRFCMRKRSVGHATTPPSSGQVLTYIAAHQAIRDVILSGGDPLLLEDDELDRLLAGLRAIPHVEIIRIGSRVPVTLPERVTGKLCRLLKKYRPVYLNTHFNHPREVSPEAAKACSRLADAGIPLGNQTVLLRGVNDDPAVMGRLMQMLLTIRVRPYYIHQMDLVQGTGHFRTTLASGLAVLESLRGHTSGLATPHYVVDLPGGKGKVALQPELLRWQGERLQLRNYRGEWLDYPDSTRSEFLRGEGHHLVDDLDVK